MKKHSDTTYTTANYKYHRIKKGILSLIISLTITFSSLIGLVPDIALAIGDENVPPSNDPGPVNTLEIQGDNGDGRINTSFVNDGGTIYLTDGNDNLASVVCKVDGTVLTEINNHNALSTDVFDSDSVIEISITPSSSYQSYFFTIGLPGGRGLTGNPRVACSGNAFNYSFKLSDFGVTDVSGFFPISVIAEENIYSFYNFLDDQSLKHIILCGGLVNNLCDSDKNNGYVEYSTNGTDWILVTDRVTTLDPSADYQLNFVYNDDQLGLFRESANEFAPDELRFETNTLILWLENRPSEISMCFTTPNGEDQIPADLSISYNAGGVTGILNHDKSPTVVSGQPSATVTVTLPDNGQYYVFARALRGGRMDGYENEIRMGEYYVPGLRTYEITLETYGDYKFDVWRYDQFSVDWSYDTTRNPDEIIIGGRVEFYSAVLPDGSDGYLGPQGDPSHDIISHRILPGSLVTISLTPDYGYQFLEGFLMHEIPVNPSEDLGYFTFEMPACPVHMSSLFVEYSDEIISNVEGIPGGILLGGQNATDVGNVRLSVNNADLTTSEQAAITSAASGMYVLNTVDLSLVSFVKKGSESSEWTNPITEASNDVMIVLDIGTGLDPDATYEVIREHNGVLTTIPAEYDPNTGLLTFSSNQFSTYAIVSSSPRSGDSDSGSGSGSSGGSSGSGGDSLTVDGLIGRLYVNMLGRSGDASGMDYWKNKIYTEGMTGADLVNGFIGSQEFTNLGLNDTEFVKILYKTMFGREGDADGINTWVTMLSAGASRQEIVNNFINSTEWANLCLRYGIRSGGTGIPNITVVPNVGTNNFVNRLYTLCLGRSADQGGFTYWTNSLANMRISGTDCAFGFVFSDEVSDANLSDEEFIKLLYSVLLGRDAGESEIANWMNQLQNGKTREEIFYGFAGSTEFGRICAENGIVR